MRRTRFWMVMSACLFLPGSAGVWGQSLEAPQEAWLLSEMPLSEVYEVLGKGSHAFVLGEDFDQRHVLLRLDRGAEQPTFTARIEAPEFGVIRTPAHLRLGLSQIQTDGQGDSEGIEYLVLLVVADDTTTYYEQYETWLYLWPLESGGKVLGQLRKIKLGATSVALQDDDPGGRWSYIAGPGEQGAAEQSRPGFRTFVRVLVGDWNGDGYQDLVLWSRICESRELGKPVETGGRAFCSPVFRLASQDVEVLLFDPEAKTFGSETREEPTLSDELWEDGMTVSPYGGPGE